MINLALTQFPRKYYFDDIPFSKLMRKRIHKVLLIASNYDAFILESDGRIDERIFNEYTSLNLSNPPEFIQVPSEEQALKAFESEHIDLVICMLTLEDSDSFELAKNIKKKQPTIPIVVLTPFSREVTLKLSNEDLSIIDYIFSWLGNPDLLVGIIKLLEDKMNVEHDALEVGVQVVLLVEDSIRFYSSYLPNIYKIIFQQTNSFMTEGLNDHQRMMRKRGRPKLVMATTYEEAIVLFDKYEKNLLGIISDINYKRNGHEDPEAGFRLLNYVKSKSEFLPFVLQSSDLKYQKAANDLGVGFINKYSNTLANELRNFMMEYFAFGDFVFIDPITHNELMRAPRPESSPKTNFSGPRLLFRVPYLSQPLIEMVIRQGIISFGRIYQGC